MNLKQAIFIICMGVAPQGIYANGNQDTVLPVNQVEGNFLKKVRAVGVHTSGKAFSIAAKALNNFIASYGLPESSEALYDAMAWVADNTTGSSVAESSIATAACMAGAYFMVHRALQKK